MSNAVIVIDMLKGFLEEGYPLYCGEAGRRIIPNVQKLLEREIARGSKILYLCDHHAPDECHAAELPDWLQRELTGSRRRAGHSVAHWRQLVRQGVGEGERNNTIASFSGHLLWHGVDPDVVQELLLCWNAARCRPPLSDEEVIRTVESITHLHERRDVED